MIAFAFLSQSVPRTKAYPVAFITSISVATVTLPNLTGTWVTTPILERLLPWIPIIFLSEDLSILLPSDFMKFSEMTLMEEPLSSMMSTLQPATWALHIIGVFPSTLM